MPPGRLHGSLSRRTLEKREYEARIAKNQIADARKRHEKLAKELLSQFMHKFAELAAKFQPTLANGKRNPRWDEDKYKEWALMAVDVAKALAPYQSPTFKAIRIAFQDQVVAEQGIDEPVRYPTLAEVRNELARRGLPPLRHLIEGTVIDESAHNGHNDGSEGGGDGAG
jgi:hypothetical protein